MVLQFRRVSMERAKDRMKGIIMRSQVALSLLSLVLVCGAGCSDPNGLQPVSGSVSFQGKPLDQGAIQFLPVDGSPSESGAGIKDGQYSIPVENGLAPGKYKVTVFSYDESGAKVPDNTMPGDVVGVQFKERIPAKYNTQTSLTAEIEAGKENKVDFQLDD
jgi:hypothetical protein